MYRKLAAQEEAHATFWEGKLREIGHSVPPRKIGWRTRVLGWLAKHIGPAFVLPSINNMEQADSFSYDHQPEAAGTPMPSEERSHARLLRTISSGMEGSDIAQMEGRHRASSGNALRAAVLGANDGLLSNFSLVMGVAGAQLNVAAILITGLRDCWPAQAQWRWASGCRCKAHASFTRARSGSRKWNWRRSRKKRRRN